MSIKLSLAIAPENALDSAFVVYRDKLEISLEKVAKLGYDGAELALLRKDQVNISEVKKILSATGLEIPVISTGQIFADTGVSFSHPDKSKREKALSDFLGLMDVAADFNSMINVGRLRGSLQPGVDSVGFFKESMFQALDAAKERGVTIILEPVNRYEINFLNNCKDSIEMIESFNSPYLKLMPDIFHMNIEDPSIEGSFFKYKDHIKYIHFADSNRWAPGRGHMDFLSIIESIKSSGYSGYISVEILPYPEPDIAAYESINYLRKFI